MVRCIRKETTDISTFYWYLICSYIDGKHEKFNFIDEMVNPPGSTEIQCVDHPLSEGPESTWSTFFKDNEVLLQIDKDVRRLCPDISFFQQATEYPNEEVVYSKGERRLHNRVVPSILSSANVERKGLGITKVSFYFLSQFYNLKTIFFVINAYLNIKASKFLTITQKSDICKNSLIKKK